MAERGTTGPTGPLLRAYLLASHTVPLFAPSLLRRRLRRGKEDADRWQEKLGKPTQPRPDGPVIWLHAVGLGEVLALRGLIAEMGAQRPDVTFLVTSTARSSAQVMGANLPPRTLHQFLPLDAPRYLARFLDHWRPSLSVWAEQELWPGAVVAARARGIPLALINARLTEESHAKRFRLRGLYADMLSRFAHISAQDQATADRLASLGARGVEFGGSLKPAAPPLGVDTAELERLRACLAGRKVWVAASTHPADERAALAAAQALPDRLLVLVPRDIGRADSIAAELSATGLDHLRRSAGGLPQPQTQVWLADSYGELGLWYRLADAALIGGSFDATNGHNPWEAAALDVAILHGQKVSNFAADYAALAQAQAARQIAPAELARALQDPDLAALAPRARKLTEHARGSLAPLARKLLSLGV